MCPIELWVGGWVEPDLQQIRVVQLSPGSTPGGHVTICLGKIGSDVVVNGPLKDLHTHLPHFRE